MTTLTDLSVLDQYAATPFNATCPATHRTFNAPNDRVATAIATVLESVTDSLVVAMFSYDWPQLVNPVVLAVQVGVPTLVVLDSSQYEDENEKRALAPLMALRDEPNLRLSVGTAPDGRSISHWKVAVVDGSVCITGSFNWTSSAREETNQSTIGLWKTDAALLTSAITAVYEYQIATCEQPTTGGVPE